jgi:putative endonuclease
VSNTNYLTGKHGEEVAVLCLRQQGYRILAKNYKTRLGEIDIVAEDAGTICFVEVKMRKSDFLVHPKEAVGKEKQRRITCAALMFLKENRLPQVKIRFDIVSVIRRGSQATTELLKGAFQAQGNFSY